MDASQIRAFIAIELNDELRNALGRAQRRLQESPQLRMARWVQTDNIHLTLKFLGNVEPARIEALGGALGRAGEDSAPFTLTVRGLGCFPNTRRPNNIWVGLEGDVARAAELTRRLEDECAELGLPRAQRPFSPHLTLGRVKRDARPADRAAIGALVEKFPPETFGNIHANAVHLIRSDLRSTGPIYSTLASAALRGA